MMPDPLLLLLDVLVCYRLARLVVKDSLLQEVRWWILNRWPSELTTYPGEIVVPPRLDSTVDTVLSTLKESGREVFLSAETDEDGMNLWKPVKTYKLTELIECVYCASVWISFGVMALNPWHGWLMYFGTSLAVAGGVALIFSRLDTE